MAASNYHANYVDRKDRRIANAWNVIRSETTPAHKKYEAVKQLLQEDHAQAAAIIRNIEYLKR